MIKSITASMLTFALVACSQPAAEEVVDQPVAETPAETPPPQLVDTPPQNEVKVP